MKKVHAVQTKDYIADAIRSEILSGRVEAGEELTQETLAQMLGVSRMPVREALQMLEQEGFLLRLPNRHMVVADLKGGRMEEIVRLAAAMETEIILLCIDKQSVCSPDALAEMEQALAGQRLLEAAGWELEYHLHITAGLNNTYITQLFQKILSGYIASMISMAPRDLHASMEALRAVHGAAKQGRRESVRTSVSDYYQELLDGWQRKGLL